MVNEDVFGQGGLNPQVDAEELLDRVGLDEDEIDWRKDHLGFDSEDVRRLSELEESFRAEQNEIADRFYDNITQHDRTLDIITRSPKGIEQLKQTQRAYLVTLATGEYGEDYFRNRARIGKLHEILDMPLNFYIGQYGVYYTLVFEVLDERMQENVVEAIREWTAEEMQDRDDKGVGSRLLSAFGSSDDHATDAAELSASLEETVREEINSGVLDLLAVLRLFNLDMQVAVDTYIDSYNADLERAIERRKQLAAEVQQDVWQPLRDVNTSAQAVAESAQAISAQADDSNRKMRSVAEEIANVSAAAEEIAATTDDVQEQGANVQRTAKRGKQGAREALSAMEQVRDATEEAAEDAAELDQLLGEFDEAIDTIDDVVRRTKQLGREATLEANRASGDSERLDALSEEVKSFADETEDELAAIRRQVGSMRDPIRSAVESMDEATNEVESGAETVEITTEALDEIVAAVSEVTNSIEDVAAATDSQAESAEAVAAAADDAAAGADQVAAETEDIAAATEEQKAQVSEIAHSVKRLTDEETE